MAIITLNNNSLSSVTSLPAAISTGKVLQVQSTFKSSVSTVSTNGDSFVDITGMSVSINQSYSSNKILCQASLFYMINNSTYGNLGGVRFMRDSTAIGIGGQDYSSGTVVGHDNSNSYTGIYATVPLLFLDSPNTSGSAVTYKLQIKNSIGGDINMYVNGRRNGSNYGSSTITVSEIEA